MMIKVPSSYEDQQLLLFIPDEEAAVFLTAIGGGYDEPTEPDATAQLPLPL